MPWVGGKKALRKILGSYLPADCERYVEVFGGAAWLLFSRPPGRFEVYNDFNGLLVNLFRCVREKPYELIEALRFHLNAREEFARILRQHNQSAQLSITECDVQLAAEFYYLIRASYASSLTSFACQPHDFWRDFPLILAAHRRLARTVIECQDFEALLLHYDRPETVFYLDPPYYGTEDFYQNIGKEGFGKKDHIRLRDTLLDIDGRFLLSYNEHPFVRELYEQPGITIKKVERMHNFRQRFEAGAVYGEYLIANYDLDAARNGSITQLDLFSQAGAILH